MKLQFREYQRRSILPLAGLALAAYYLMVFVPIKYRATGLDAPLNRAWQKLAASLDQTNALNLDFLLITNQLSETRQALTLLESARSKAAARIELTPGLRARLNAPFQLVDYENERSKIVDELSRLARQQKITVDYAVYAGFPEHTADVQQPTLLWASLSFVEDLLLSAVQCKVSAIHSLEVPLSLTNAPTTSGMDRLDEIPIQVEFSGPAPGIDKLIQSLPLRADEIRAARLMDAPPEKPALFIDRLVIKKQAPEKPEELRVSLRVVGFVLHE